MKKIFSSIFQYIKDTDKYLLLFCVIASSFSATMIAGIANSGYATERQVFVQIGASGIGILAALIMSKIDYRFMARLWKLHSALGYSLVLLTFIIGIRVSETVDDRAWLNLPMGLTLQPSEFLKISFIVTLALHLQKVQNHLNSPKVLLSLCAHGALPVGLVMLQGDHGTALIFAMIFVCMIFTAGLSWKYIIAAASALIVALPPLWHFILDDDKRMRILTVFNPALDPKGVGWQQTKGLLSIGSGQMWGKGVFSGVHQFIPMMYNDFIFAFVGEALGMVGCLAVIIIIFSICLKILFTSFAATDLLGKYICVGVFAMFVSQAFLNIGMCLSVLPVIGITLPFFSAGGTSVVASYLGIGLSLSVHMHNKKNLFTEAH